MKLRTHIESKLAKLGNTPTGADWCLKALHPADPLVEVRGIPDLSAVPSCFLNYQTVARIGPAEGATGTWSYDATVLPHPVAFMAHRVIDTVNPGGVDSATLNAQLTGLTHRDKFNNFRAQCRRWRLAYMSVTVHQDGPDLANQGTMVVSQVPIQPKIYNASFQIRSDAVGGAADTDRTLVCCPHYALFSDLDRPNYEASQAMPNAYFNQSKFGAYVPLKLTATCQQWRSDADNIAVLPYNTASDFDESGSFYMKGMAVCGPVGGDPWPFPGLNPASAQLQTAPDAILATTPLDSFRMQGEITSALCNDVWAQISARNMAVTTSLSIFIRVGFEVQVLPTSVLSPHQKLSPPHDPQALEAYFHIARELKDGYPEDYNGLGKILGVIGEAASTVAPFLNFIPKVGPLISPLAAGGGKILKGIAEAKRVKKEVKRSKMTDSQAQTIKSAADIERARAQRN